MSRLNDLITELCPQGVEYRLLGEIAKAENGRNKDRHCEKAYSITQRGLIPTSEYFGDTKITSDDTSGYKIVKKGWFVYSPSRIDVGSINYLKDAAEVIVSPLNVVFSIDAEKICQDYLLNFLNSRSGTWQILTKREGIEGTGRKLLPFERFATIEIPVPPLSIQREIVWILNNFTELTTELTAELIARKKQYEYYRNTLLLFKKDVSLKPLGELCQLITGATPSKMKSEYWEGGTIPWMSSGEVNLKRIYTTESHITPLGYSKSSTSMVPIHSVVIALAGQGKTRGKVAITEIELCTNQSLCSMICKQGLDYRYLYYYLDSKYDELRAISNGDGTRGGLSLRILAPYKIPVPSLDEQRRIVAILDRFENLCHDDTYGLPAEIAARQKQYEYYRDKLLTFKKLA